MNNIINKIHIKIFYHKDMDLQPWALCGNNARNAGAVLKNVLS